MMEESLDSALDTDEMEEETEEEVDKVGHLSASLIISITLVAYPVIKRNFGLKMSPLYFHLSLTIPTANE